MRPPPSWLRQLPIAHRGLHGSSIPGNTIAAFQAAASAGYAIELDVQSSRDGVVVVSHSYVARDIENRARLISRSRMRDLQTMGADLNSGTVCPLNTILDLINGRVPVYVDLKPQPRARRIASAVASVLSCYKGPSAVLSFDPRVLLWFRQEAPHILRGQSAGLYHSPVIPALVQAPVTTMPLNAMTQPDFVAYDLHALPNRAMDYWRANLEFALILWGVRTRNDECQAMELDANIMFDDIRPDLRTSP